ncbi:uncharacterized protein KY384_001964 [Bacidia gigantensis]|uniref:uncharacterized protein n=1 Tax=Bacidia gigantensis TaxID=2732470 RepID=UPI001D04F947|nr:uncharacterized protein KY384_001964 [Bacidia gigantensis]KAG8533181.1 hypothetical protein KY384_001964 [Bacidia gigantensis]
MSTRPLLEVDGPSSSSNLVPQLLQSRRGSIASLSSVNLLSKETISEALDQIHSTASQSETLTTFNEYTSPPPVSATSASDNKSIAGDIQGGISGLYNRFRASVGAKDVPSPAIDDVVSERASTEDSGVRTPASGVSHRSGLHPTSASEAHKKQESLERKTSSAADGKLKSDTLLERAVTLKPPSTPSKLVVKDSAFDPARNGDKEVEESQKQSTQAVKPDTDEIIRRIIPKQLAAVVNGKGSSTRSSHEDVPAKAFVGPREPSQPSLQVSHTQDDRDQSLVKPGVIVINQRSDDVFDVGQDNSQHQVGKTEERDRKYQHLEVPLRKSLAPPVVSRSSSPMPGLSRGSSLETTTESLGDALQQSSPRRSLASFGQASRSESLETDSQTYSNAPAQRDQRTMSVFSQAKSKVLSKEYWMKDENAKDCFGCGDAFSTFRRTCGQIFDAKCTSVISGNHFNQAGTLRVCKPCESIIKGDDDSSEFSDDGTFSLAGFRPRHGSTGAGETLGSPMPTSYPSATENPHYSASNPDLSVPIMSIPATRKAGEKAGRKPAVVEIGTERGLARPSSSRSLKSSFGSRSTHRRYNSRNQFTRVFKPTKEDDAPFHHDITNNGSSKRLATFHDDNIIDPDLAPYLSDEQSSGDEQVSIMTALNASDMSVAGDDRHGWETAAASRKGRLKFGEKSSSSVTFASRDADTHSLSGAKSLRPSKRRTFSTSSASHLRPSPKSYRASAMVFSSSASLRESALNAAAEQAAPSPTPTSGRMVRSSSLRGASAPAIELNDASLQHVRKLLYQLLTDNRLSEVARWEKALLPILLRATDDVNPDVQNGDDMDVRHYVKLKKIPGGRPCDTAYVSGLVFTKNLALKTMPRHISHPNILILTFPLEYARHQQHFMSLEPVIRQEREFLQNIVNRIAALRPQLLLVERHVSGLALQFLEQANIATAYNVKPSVLEAVSRCCQTRIISSMDKLAIKPAQVGKCASFYLKTYLHQGRKKTYTFLSGCSRELGCTIVLRGASTSALRKIKSITEFMIYVVYNLKLETSLMKDEYALIPSDIDIGSLSSSRNHAASLESKNASEQEAMENSQSSEQSKLMNGHDLNCADSEHPRRTADTEQPNITPSLPDEDSVPDDIPMPTFYTDMVEKHQTKILSASPFVKFMQPYLLMRAREQERRLAYLRRLRDQDIQKLQIHDDKARPEKFDLIKPEMVHKRVPDASKKVREVLYAVHDAEYDKALHIYQTQCKQWETYLAGSIDLFDPYAHQNIAVLYSVVCTATTIPCSGPDMVALGYYNEHETDADFEADCTLGQYVEDLCLGGNTPCSSNGCEKQMIEHHRQYVHGEAQLSVFVEHQAAKVQGLSHTILMWSTCRKCAKETQVMHMSESSWKYSFGKYLELSFWSTELRAQDDICPHDLHRDHLRYFGFKDMAVRIQYDPITLLEIIVPRARITWKVDNDLQFKNDVYTRIEERFNKFMVSVKSRIRSISAETVVPEKAENCRREVERLAKKANDDHLFLITKLREKYMSSKHYEIIPLNRATRALQEKVAEWDNVFSEFDRSFFPSEKDIRRLATLQLRKIFLDRENSSTSLTSEGSASPAEALDEKRTADDVPTLASQTRRMSPDKTRDMLASVVENDSIADLPLDEQNRKSDPPMLSVPSGAGHSIQVAESPSVRHLDLAIPADVMDQSQTIEAMSLSRSSSSPQSPKLEKSTPPNPHTVKAIENPPEHARSKHEMQNDATRTTGPSSIPRPSIAGSVITTSGHTPPPINRAYSQPAIHRNADLSGQSIRQDVLDRSRKSKRSSGLSEETFPPSNNQHGPTSEKVVVDRRGESSVKAKGMAPPSMIPRSIAGRRRETRVSHLAMHFEQLSREFEKERLKEKRQRAALNRRSRAHPMRVSKPIVQVYRNVNEAVEEKEPSDEDLLSSDPSIGATDKDASQEVIKEHGPPTTLEAHSEYETTAENTEIEDTGTSDSRVVSDVEGEGVRSDDEQYLFNATDMPDPPDQSIPLTPEEAQLQLKLELPKHEKTSLMKMLTNFWAERSASGWQPLEYPLMATAHIFADSDIIVREDEPSSLIAFALGSQDYYAKLRSIIESSPPSAEKIDESRNQDPILSPADQVQVEEALLRPTGTHLKYQFSEGSAKMLCKIFFAEQFDAVRRKCGVSSRIVESLARCGKWDSKGGKSKSVFLKTLDDRFVLKSLSPIETQAFLRFAPAYFRIMSESLFHELPSVIAKMLGFYQIIIKNPTTGVEFNWFLLVMENLFYDRSPTRIFDLKGSMRNRRIQSTGEQNEVLLDENMVEFIYESPLFAREHSKKLLRASVWNDTLFLSRQNVMDYSLMIAIDDNKKELVVGIIDCIRTYTWDKRLESWIKDRGKNRPTVTSPKEYKSRFREAMGRYVLQAPNCWHQFKAQHIEARPLLQSNDDPGDDKEAQVLGLA